MGSDALVLALDTSAAHCAAAVVHRGQVLARRHEEMARGQSERLVPLLGEVLAEAHLCWSDVDLVAVCTGPGNFTGIRIGVAAARGLALARGVPSVGVTVLEALAHGQEPCRVTLDARRGGIYAQTFPDGAPQLTRRDALEPEPGLLCLGHDATAIAAQTSGKEGSDAVIAPLAAIAEIALARTAAGDAQRPAPLYLRGADAALPSEPPLRILP